MSFLDGEATEREVGDIENDLGFVTGQIEMLNEDIAELVNEKEELMIELAAVS